MAECTEAERLLIEAALRWRAAEDSEQLVKSGLGPAADAVAAERLNPDDVARWRELWWERKRAGQAQVDGWHDMPSTFRRALTEQFDREYREAHPGSTF